MKINLDDKSISLSCKLNNWGQVDWLYKWLEMNGEILFGKRENKSSSDMASKQSATILKIVKDEDK